MNVLDSFRLDGRLALVTGSSAGIGLALARGLAQAGARVVLNGRDSDRLAAARDALRGEGLAVEAQGFDVADRPRRFGSSCAFAPHECYLQICQTQR